MLDLTTLPLLADAPELRNLVLMWREDHELNTHSAILADALRHGNYAHPIFQNPKYLECALLAYTNETISLAQFTTLSMLWAATEDYSPSIKQHSVQTDNRHHPDNRLLFSFLSLTSDNLQTATRVSPDQQRAILAAMRDETIPVSERCFFTFSIDSHSKSANDIISAIRSFDFALLMPREINGKLQFIIPSFTLLQKILATLGKYPVTLEPVIGATSMQRVLQSHHGSRHPLGLSFPDFEHGNADGFRAGKFGFIWHDIYHLILMLNNFLRAAFNDIAGHGYTFLATQPPESHAEIENIIARLVDQEFTQFLLADTMIASVNQNPLATFQFVEMKLLNCLAQCFLPSIVPQLQAVAEHAKQTATASDDDNNTYNTHIEAFKAVIARYQASPVVVAFVRYIIATMMNHAHRWHEDYGISIAKLLQFATTSQSPFDVIFKEAPAFVLETDYELHLVRKTNNMMRQCISDTEALRPYLDANGQAWLAKYQQNTRQIADAIADDDVASLQEIDNDPSQQRQWSVDAAIDGTLTTAMATHANQCATYLSEKCNKTSSNTVSHDITIAATSLLTACEAGDSELLQNHLAGLDQNTLGALETGSKLFACCMPKSDWTANTIACVKLLVAYGVDINDSTEMPGRSVFQSPTTYWGSMQSIKRSGTTALDMPLELLSYCIEHNADPNQVSVTGKSPLYYALERYLQASEDKAAWLHYCKLLLSKGADVNQVLHVDHVTTSPFFLAVAKASIEILSLLLPCDADLQQTLQGKTIIDTAIAAGRDAVCLHLLRSYRTTDSRVLPAFAKSTVVAGTYRPRLVNEEEPDDPATEVARLQLALNEIEETFTQYWALSEDEIESLITAMKTSLNSISIVRCALHMSQFIAAMQAEKARVVYPVLQELRTRLQQVNTEISADNSALLSELQLDCMQQLERVNAALASFAEAHMPEAWRTCVTKGCQPDSSFAKKLQSCSKSSLFALCPQATLIVGTTNSGIDRSLTA